MRRKTSIDTASLILKALAEQNSKDDMFAPIQLITPTIVEDMLSDGEKNGGSNGINDDIDLQVKVIFYTG